MAMMYYFFNDYSEVLDEKVCVDDEEAREYADEIGAEYFCTDET